MQRREFITLLSGAAAAWPLVAWAQQAHKVWRIGFLAGGSRPVPLGNPFAAFLQGMRELGYAEGKDFVMEWRFAENRTDLFPDLAVELVRLRVDVIVLGTGLAVPAVAQATKTIPIVMGAGVDPVGRGYVNSLAHPGGNITGLSNATDDSTPKQLELLTTIAPNLTRVGFAMNPASDGHRVLLKIAQASAERVRLALIPVQMRSVEDIPVAFTAVTDARGGAILVPADAFFFSQRQRIAEQAIKSRLPSMFVEREYAEAGGLMSYGQSLAEQYRQTASYVDKIFKGESPAQLPIQLPTKFDFVINRRTADELGVTIPAPLYVFADEVIE